MSLTDKLRRLIPQQNNLPASTAQPETDLDGFLDGREVSTPYGLCYVVEKSLPLTERHGYLPLQLVRATNYESCSRLGMEAQIPLAIKDALFLDTETTGLAGGTGTYPFLIGLGSFSDSHFQVKQLLMRDYNEELAILYLLEQELQAKQTVISFNGKAFDLPLLQTRFTISRAGFQGCADKDQLDLLQLARKIWRYRLSSCSLSSLETNVLHVRRINDIPGFEIPGRYFQFLHSQQGYLLQDIMEHNVIDIVSMATLLYRLELTLRQEPEECACPWEAEALARLALDDADYQRGLLYLQQARQRCQSKVLQIRVLRTTAQTYKRLGAYEQACTLWRELLELAGDDLSTHEELAKHYEHRLKDLAAAERITRRALAIAWRSKSVKAADFEHRLNRLLHKAAPHHLDKTHPTVDH